MNAREELLTTRRLGLSGAELLYRTVWLVAVGNRFPPPQGTTVWDETAVAETAHDFLDGERGRKRLLDIAVRSVDEQSFRRLLEKSVRNFLRDIARATDFGKLVVRVKEILRDETNFEEVPGSGGRWALSGGPTAPGEAHPDDLAAAVASIEVVVPKWSSERRHAPLADRPSFVRLMTSIVEAAGGGLTAVDISHALAKRLDYRRTALTIDIDSREGVAEPAAVSRNPATHAAAELHATDIFNSLSDRERVIVTTLDKNVRDLGRLIGTGKSQAALARQQLVDRLRNELADEEDPDATATILCRICEEWVDLRTKATDATSNH